jgi:hypothetical protein
MLETLAPANVPNAPHINRRRIPPQLKQQFGRTVPARHNKAGIVSQGLAIALSRLRRHLVEVASQAEVGNLKNSLVVDQEIGR